MATRKSKSVLRNTKKGLNSAISKLTGKKTQEEVKDPAAQGAEQIARAKDMASILKCIRFDTSPLPAEILEKKHSPTQKKTDMELFRDAGINLLERGNITELDTEKIDETLRYAVNTFEEGVRNGQPEKAQRGGFSVLYIASALRKEVDETEQEMVQQIKAEREEMCSFMKTMMKLCRRVDALEGMRTKKLVNFDEGTNDVQLMQDNLQEYLKSDEGAAIMSELQDNMIHPDRLSTKAQELDGQFTILARKEEHLFALRGELRALTEGVSEARAQLERVVETINSRGYVEDPELQSRIEEILKAREEALAKLQADNTRVRESLDAHDAAMRAIISDPNNAIRTAKNMEFWEKKQKEAEEQRERQLAAKQKRLEDLKKQREQQERDAAMEREIRKLEEELPIVDTIEDVEEDSDYIDDYVEEQEENYLLNE